MTSAVIDPYICYFLLPSPNTLIPKYIVLPTKLNDPKDSHPLFCASSQESRSYITNCYAVGYNICNMTPQIRFEPSRTQQRLKRMPHSSEAERRRLFALGRFLEVQEERQPRPFLNTALGKLPPELRVMIYQHLLVIFRLEADNDHNTEKANGSTTISQPFIHLKQSGLSILRTCGQLKHEAPSTIPRRRMAVSVCLLRDQRVVV